MIARHLRCGGLDKAKTLARLEERLRAEGVEDPYEWKGLTRWLHPVDEEQDDGGTMRLQSVVERYFLLSRVLARACRRRPVIVWLDDLQWATTR